MGFNPFPGVKWPAPKLEGSTATYVDVVPGVDVRVEMRPHGFEQFWVVKTPAAAKGLLKGQGSVRSVTARLTAKGLVAKSNAKAGRVDLVDAKGRPVGAWATALAWDAATDAATGDPKHVIEGSLGVSGATGSDAQLSVGVDAAWLEDPARTFPITIDPSYLEGAAVIENFDTYVYSQYKNTDLSTQTGVRLGFDGVGYMRTWLNFPTAAFNGKKIIFGEIILYEYQAWSCNQREWQAYDADPATTASRYLAQPAVRAKVGSSTRTLGGGTGCPAEWVGIEIGGLVQQWANAAATTRGVMLRAADENVADYHKKFYSSEQAAGVAPRIVWGYDRAPGATAAPTFPTGVDYTPPGASVAVPHVAVRRPQVSVVLGADADGDQIKGLVEFYSDAAATTKVGSCESGLGSPSRTVSCVPASDLPSNTRLWVRARAMDSLGLVGAWSALRELRVADLTPAVPTVTCGSYTDKSWGASVPGGTQACTVSVAGMTGPSAPSKLTIKVDGATLTQAVAQPAAGATGSATVTVNLTAGEHVVRATSSGPAGITSAEKVFSFGFGDALAWSKPAAGFALTTTDTVTIEAAGPGTSVNPASVLQWRVAGATDPEAGWVDVPAGSLRPVNGASVLVSQVNGATRVTGVFNAAALSGLSDGAGVQVLARRPVRIELRIKLSYSSGTKMTPSGSLVRVPHAFGKGFPEADAGPGKVALWTGELSVAETDAELSAPAASLSVSRAHNSFAGPATVANEVFGPGWVAAFDGDDGGGLSAADMTDSTTVDGTISLASAEGDTLVFTTPTGARRTGATIPVGSYVPANDDTDLSGTTLTVTADASTVTATLISEDGVKTLFRAPVPASGVAAVFKASEVVDPAQPGKTVYNYDAAGRVIQIIAPLPDGVSGCVAGTATAGCRMLKFTYGTGTTPDNFNGRLQKVTAQVNTDPDRELARYTYDTAGRLITETDVRTNLTTSYTWVGTGDTLRLATLTPPGRDGYTFAYAGNKLTSVTRPNPTSAGGGTAQLGAFVYEVPMAGTVTDLVDLATETATWGQKSTPTHAYAVFGPDAPISGTPAAGAEVWRRADLQFTDDDGYTVNTGSYAAGDWQFTAADYDSHDNVVKSWDIRATRRVRDGQITGDLAAAITVYNTDITNTSGEVVTPAGSLVTESYTPVNAVISGGVERQLRSHTVISYDEAAPNSGTNPATGQPYRLQTKSVTTAETDAGQVVETVSTSFTGYNDTALDNPAVDGWSLAQATRATTDMDGSGTITSGDITRITRYDQKGRVVLQQQPKSAGGDAGTRKTVYYTGAVTADGCGSKPEYSGWVCKVGPADGTILPTTTSTAYTWDGQVASSQETSGSVTATTTTSFDASDRPVTVSTTTNGLAGSRPVPAVTTSYDNTTGDVTGTSSSAGSTATQYDRWGRVTMYSNTVAGATDSSTTSYNLAGQVTGVSDNNGAVQYTYDGTDAAGNTEYRGLVTTAQARKGTGPWYTSAAAYDFAGALVQENLPGQITRWIDLDGVGKTLGMRYTGPAGGLTDQPWFGWSSRLNAQGQIAHEWTPTGAALSDRLV